MPLFRVRFNVTLPIGDVGNFGFWLDSGSGVQNVANDAAAWATDLMVTQTLNAHYTTNTDIVNVVVGQYDTVTGSQQLRAEQSVNEAGTVDPSVTPPLPGDVAVVVSLETALANRSGRGRFYLPAPITGDVSSDGRMIGTLESTFANAVAAAFGSLTVGTLVVASRVLNTANPVTAVAVGNIFDTMRSRENAAIEARTRVEL